MLISNPTAWTLVVERPGKRIYRRFNMADDCVEYMEEWDEDFQLSLAAEERELNPGSKNLKPLAVIPASVLSRSILEGWSNDDDRWRRWANDSDNRNLRITDGTA